MIRSLVWTYRTPLAFATLLAVMAAAGNIVLLDYLSAQASGGRQAVEHWLPRFLAGVAGLFAAQTLANSVLALVSAKAIERIRKRLADGVLSMSYADIEHRGKGTLLSLMTDDVDNLSEALSIAPQLLLNTVTALACCAYLAWLSPTAFAWFGFVVLAGAGITVWVTILANRRYESFRIAKESYYSHLHTLFDGAKELATGSSRRKHFSGTELVPALQQLRQLQVRWDLLWHFSEVWTRVLLFTGLGVALAAIQLATQGDIRLTMSYFVVITFLAGAVDFVVNGVSTAAKGLISARMLESHGMDSLQAAAAPASTKLSTDWKTITLEQVSFQASNASFQLGPIDFTLRRGEVVFLIGGNGSGKTTFVKVLNGLYGRSSGAILVDGVEVADTQGTEYQSLFSTIYSDFHLFGSVIDAHGRAASSESLQTSLRRLRVENKVTVKDGKWSSVRLSQGQRKRLAMAQAWMDDAPIYVLDEWAADQDPDFRAFFYCELIPQLKAQGKTLVVISHDDRYYHVADRVVKFEDGRIRSERHAGEGLDAA